LTPEFLEEVRRLPTCLYLETVSAYLGIARCTWTAWSHQGRAEARRLAQDRVPSHSDPKSSTWSF
jgi:hypothetical protein